MCTLTVFNVLLQELFPTAKPKETQYRKLTGDYVSTFEVRGEKMLRVRAHSAGTHAPRLCRPGLARLA